MLLHEEESEQELLEELSPDQPAVDHFPGKLADYFPAAAHPDPEPELLAQRDCTSSCKPTCPNSSSCWRTTPRTPITYSNLLANFLFNANLDMDGKSASAWPSWSGRSSSLSTAPAGSATRRRAPGWIRARTSWTDPGEEQGPGHRRPQGCPTYASGPTGPASDPRRGRRFRPEGPRPWRGRTVEELHGPGHRHGRAVPLLPRLQRGTRSPWSCGTPAARARWCPRCSPTRGRGGDPGRGGRLPPRGENSYHLFYIVSGQFEIIANGKCVSVLTPQDIFLGEMSFLLSKPTAARPLCGPRAGAS